MNKDAVTEWVAAAIIISISLAGFFAWLVFLVWVFQLKW